MKIKARQSLKDIRGKDIEPEGKVFTVGDAIANILLSSKEGGKMKMYLLAQNFVTKDVVEVDEADKVIIIKAIEGSNDYTNLITGQLLLILSKI